LALALLVSACAPRLAQLRPFKLKGMPPADRAELLERDLGRLGRWSAGLQRVDAFAEQQRALLEAPPSSLDLDQRATVLEVWRNLLEHVIVLEHLSLAWSEHEALPAGDPARLKAGLLHRAAFLAVVHAGLRTVRRVQSNRALVALYDEPRPELAIPERSFSTLRTRVVHVQTVGRVLRDRKEHRRSRDASRKAGLYGDDRAGPLLAWADAAYGRVVGELRREGPELFVRAGAGVVERAAMGVWFPVQLEAATWLGHTRVKRRDGHGLVTDAQIASLPSRLRAGDVLVARRNWYLSNIGLPGFWPHAALWLGTPEELDRALSGPGLAAFLEAEGAASPSAWLRQRRPAAVLAWTSPDKEERPPRMLEAIGPGVSFTAAEHGADADYLAALRPRLDPLDVLKALDAAFAHHAKPYDFDFDFATDEALVCSELVYKSYQPAEGKAGLTIPTVRVLGRTTLPPNDLIRHVDATWDDPQRLFDFVLFFDAVEKKATAVEADLPALRASHRRPKWDVVQP